MTENQSYTSLRNEEALSRNLYDYVNQNVVFELEKYGPYFDKLRAFFVPSLEYRIHSLLEEFVYNTNSRWAKQFPCFKKFINAIVMWKGPLNRVAKYDIDMMEEMMKNTIKHITKDDMITCFLDSIILHHRLNKICRELDALGFEDNILRSLNMWNFVNECNYLLDCNCFTDFNSTMNCSNINLNTVRCNAKKSIKYKKAVKPLVKNIYSRSTEQVSITSENRGKHRRILDSNENFHQQREDNSNHYSTCVATGSQNNNKINRSFNEKSCNTKLKKIRNSLKLKIIVYKVYLENYKYSTFSSSNITRLPLPCNPSNLIRRISKADPSLTESCLIVIKQKFKNSIYNVCSCLNSILETLNIKLTKTLCLNCEIYPGYISFKLKASNIKKYLFVARVPICQNVDKRMIQQDYFILSSKANSEPSIEINKSKCFEQYKNDGMNFKDTLEHIDNKTEKFNIQCSQLDQSFIKGMTIDISQNEAESNNEKNITCMITKNVTGYVQDFSISSCNNSCKDIIEEICDMTSCVDNSREKNDKYYNVFSSTEINRDDNVEKYKERILESSNSITKTDTSTQSANKINCICSSRENFVETNEEIKNIFSNKDLNSFSQTTGTNEYDWTCSSNKKSNLENEVCNIHTCSITSFIQNSEYDKQVVELNYNHFSNNNINMIDECFDTQENDSSLNSAKVEIGCNSCCTCRCDDFVDITSINDISKENIICAFETSQGNFDARNTENFKTMQIETDRIPRNNNLLTISVQIPRSTISSKGINVDTCYSRTILLTSDDDKNISSHMETSDRYNKIANLSTHASIISKKVNKIYPDENKKILDVKDGTQYFITSPKRFSTSKGRFRSNEDSRNSGISTREYLRVKNHSTCKTSNASLYYRSYSTSDFMMNKKRDESQKSDKSKKSKLRRREHIGSQNGIRNVISTTIKHKTISRRYPNNYPTEIRPQTILAMTKFRNSVDKSVDKIKHLIRAKLGKILFNNKISNNNKMTKTFEKNGESSEDTRRRKTDGKYIRQGNSITSCSICDRQGCITFSRKPSILSIRKTKRKRRSEENIRCCNHRLTDSNKTLLSFHSIKTSPSFNLLTCTTEDIEKQKLNRNNRYDRKEKIRNVINCNKNSHRCNLKHSDTSITISSQSTKVSLIENDSKYCVHYTYKQQEGIYDNKHVWKQVYNQDQPENEQEQCKNKNKYRDTPIKYINADSNKSLKTLLSHTLRENARNIHQQFYDVSKARNVKRFSSSRKNQQIFEKNVSNCSDDSLQFDDNSCKRHVFAILTDTYNDYLDDLELDFKLRLLRYVELCKNIKRLLMRTLQQDIYEVKTTSIFDSDL